VSANFKPYGYVVDKETRTTTVFDRLFRPLVRLDGRWPRCDFAAAEPCDPDSPRLYGAPGTAFLYHNDDAPRCDPIVRTRLADLSRRCPVLAAEVQRRTNAAEAANPVRLTHAQLMASVFSEAAA
jgi:hypothetical protein